MLVEYELPDHQVEVRSYSSEAMPPSVELSHDTHHGVSRSEDPTTAYEQTDKELDHLYSN